MSSRRTDVSHRLPDGNGDSSHEAGVRVPSGELSGQAPETVPPPKLMALRYAGTCSVCRVALPAKVKAYWHRDTHTVTCVACQTGTTKAPLPSDPVPWVELDRGTAGRSARAEYERRHHKREERIDAKFGRLAGSSSSSLMTRNRPRLGPAARPARCALRRNWRTGSGPAPSSSATAECRELEGTSTTSPSRHRACG